MQERIIQISKTRRIRAYQWGWMHEILKVKESGKDEGKSFWKDDQPAYPSKLSQALSDCLDRLLRESGDSDIGDIPKQLQEAMKVLQECEDQILATCHRKT